jgi:hypothetical protein
MVKGEGWRVNGEWWRVDGGWWRGRNIFFYYIAIYTNLDYRLTDKSNTESMLNFSYRCQTL